jgi:hypothetical protein
MTRPMSPRKRQGALASRLIATSALHEHVRPGKQALKEPEKVVTDPPSFVTDGIALDDDAYADEKTKSKRWDYWIGTEDPSKPIVGIEVHPALPREVKGMIEKKRWAESKAANELIGGKRAVRAWYWVASGKTGLSPTTTEYKQMVNAGILFAGGLLRLPR